MPPSEDPAFTKQFDWKLTRRILAFVVPYRWGAVIALGCALGVAGTRESLPFLQKQIIDNYLTPALGAHFVPFAGVLRIAFIYLGVAVVELASRYGLSYSLAWLGQHVLYDLRTAVFAKLQRLQLSYYDRNPVGRLITRVTSDVDAINQFITNGLVTLAQSLIVLAAVLGWMFKLNWRLASIASAAIPLLFVATRYFQTRFRGAYRIIRLKQAVVNTSLNENITGMQTVQLFGREARNAHDFDTLNQDFLAANLESIRWFSLFYPTVNFISTAALAVIIWYGGHRVIGEALTVGTLFAFTQWVRDFFQPLQDLSDVFNNLQAAMASAERIFGVLDEKETIADPAAPVAEENFRGDVRLRDVWFAYKEPGEKITEADWVLRGVSLHVKPGESVALVGATGAGKTSIISLVSRFYDVQKGSVEVDGIDVRQWAQRALRKHVGVVLQDVFLFAGTLHSNLTLGDTSVTAARVEEACRYVGVHDFIISLPQGYQTEVKERGATLSTGQKQLLAFARALILNPDIVLVLDEATANVDTESELVIQEAQKKLMQGRTSIIIAHRLSTIQHCDRIVVMRHGQIVEEGEHAALLARGGYYAALYQLQYSDEAAAPAA